ncbi:MAG: CoA transferase [Deltaproteobacteria bacterium]|nr:CoA transferase [Deltaproteobacteria bacterium]
MQESTQPLEGVRVLELGGPFSASMATRWLRDLGAEVVKIEPPTGDPARALGPFPMAGANPEAGGIHTFLNAGKRSLVLTPGTSDARETLQALAKHCDLVVHDLIPGAMGAWGLEYAALAAQNPRLVMLSITPFGLTGPYRTWEAGELALFFGGGWGLLCPGGGPPERAPIKMFGHHMLLQAGLHGATAALAAVRGACKSGQGEHIDLSVMEVSTLLMGRHFAYASYAHRYEDYRSPSPYEPYSFYPASDGHLYLICPEQEQWRRLEQALGDPPWVAEGRYDSRPKRQTHAAALKEDLSAITRTRSKMELFHSLQALRVGAAPVLTHREVEQEPHLQARKFFVQAAHPVLGEVKLPGAPVHFDRPWWRMGGPAPVLGEANAHRAGPKGAAGLFQPRKSPSSPPTAALKEAALELPLAGVRVLDLSWVWAGPHTTLLLGGLGAEILKVESSARPDLTRRSHLFADGLEPGPNRCGYFNAVSQYKLGVGINLSRPEGVAVVKRLAAQCDVMVSNFGFGVLEKLGLGAEQMQAVNPRLIVAMISAFGQSGPYRGYSGYGPLVPPLSGLSALTGYAEDGLPQDTGTAYGDPNGGVYAALAILAALLARPAQDASEDPERRRGAVIDVSMWEAMLYTGFEGWMHHALGLAPPRPDGNHDQVHAPRNLYACAGESHWLAVAVTTPAHWQGLCRVMERADWAADPTLAHPAGRKSREAELDSALADWCVRQDRWEATRTLQAEGVPAFPALNAMELLSDPHYAARECLTHFEHPEVGVRPLMGVPWRFTRRVNGQGRAAPRMGEHTDAVLERLLGMDAAERTRLREAGVIE